MYYNAFIHFFVDGHLDCFCTLAIVNNSAMGLRRQIFLAGIDLISLGYTPRNGIAEYLLRSEIAD